MTFDFEAFTDQQAQVMDRLGRLRDQLGSLAAAPKAGPAVPAKERHALSEWLLKAVPRLDAMRGELKTLSFEGRADLTRADIGRDIDLESRILQRLGNQLAKSIRGVLTAAEWEELFAQCTFLRVQILEALQKSNALRKAVTAAA
jgi:hypothetical protein